VRDSTFANVVSEARRAMNRHQAVAAAGEWLGRANGDHLPLHPEVVSDVDLFEAHVAAARRASDAVTAITELRSALGLVRGVPFAGSGYAWADAESLSSTVTLLVVSAAADLAENCRRVGDGPGALWATAVGLGVLPGHEQLVALRLQTHADAGDLAGVRHEWATYERALAADRWHAEPSPRLVQLCRELLGSALAGR
jgi:hypothetical protein